jgi:hypothetical protein
VGKRVRLPTDDNGKRGRLPYDMVGLGHTCHCLRASPIGKLGELAQQRSRALHFMALEAKHVRFVSHV